MPQYILIGMIVFILSFVTTWARGRFVKPTVKEGVQKPGGFDRFLMWVILACAIVVGLLAFIGILSGETEMAIVTTVITLVLVAVNVWLRHEYNLTYEENEDYFIAMIKGKEYKVYYDDIEDWKPGHKEILIADKTKPDDYVKVNISIFKPNILLRKMADKTFAGKFATPNAPANSPDPNREYELINFLKAYNYRHLVKDEATRLGL